MDLAFDSEFLGLVTGAALVLAIAAWFPWLIRSVRLLRRAEKDHDRPAWQFPQLRFRHGGLHPPRLRSGLRVFATKNRLGLILLVAGSLAAVGIDTFRGWERVAAGLTGGIPGISVVQFKNVDWQPPVEERFALPRINASRDSTATFLKDQRSWRFTTWLFASKQGTYTFYLTSDDGSTLSIDEIRTVDNPGYHGPREMTGKLFLESGFHQLELLYFNGSSDAVVHLEWAPPGRGRTEIGVPYVFTAPPGSIPRARLAVAAYSIVHAAGELLLIAGFILLGVRQAPGFWKKPVSYLKPWRVFRRKTHSSAVRDRLELRHGTRVGVLGFLLCVAVYYLPQWNPVPHGLTVRFHSGAEPHGDEIGIRVRNINFHSITEPVFRRNIFTAEISGVLRIPKTGEYVLSLQADNEAVVTIGDSPVISSRGINPRNQVEVTRSLTQGIHAISIEISNENLPAFLALKWKTPGHRTLTPIHPDYLYPEPLSAEKMRTDRLFRVMTRLLIWLAALGLVIPSIAGFFRARSFLTSESIIWGTAVFVVLMLWQSSMMNPVHQYGFQWFLKMNVIWKILVSAGILVIGSPRTKQLIRKMKHWLSRHSGCQSAGVMLSVIIAATGQFYFTRSQHRPVTGAVMMIVSLILIVLNTPFSWPSLIRREQIPLEKTLPARTFLAVFIICIGVLFRFYRLQYMPPGLWWDEAQTGLAARDLLNGHWPPVYDLRINAGSLATFLVAGWFKLIGSSSIYALRSYYAVIGILTVITSYFFFRGFFNRWWSLFGMSLIASSRWLFSINRVAMATIDETILLTFLVFIFYHHAVTEARWRDYIITGILLGTGMHLHTGARVLPVIVGVDLILRTITDGRDYLRLHMKKAMVMIFMAVLVFLPMLVHIVKHRADYFKRSKQTLLSTEYPGWYPVPVLADNIVNYLEVYPFSGDWHPRHNVNNTPQLPPLVSVLAVVGLGYSLLTFRRHRLFLMAFFLVSLQGILTVHNNTANLNRIAENIPVVYFFALMGAVLIARALHVGMGGHWSRIMTVAGCCIVFGFSSLRAAKIYFVDHQRSPSLVGVFGFQPELTESARRIKELLEANPRLEVWAEHTRADSFRYVLIGNPRLKDFTNREIPAIRPSQEAVIVTLNTDSDSSQRRVMARYPDARREYVGYSLIPGYKLFTINWINEPRDQAERIR